MDNRYKHLQSWLHQTLGTQSFQIEPLVNDASFRRYFRIAQNESTLIAMDTPPDREDPKPFVTVAKEFSKLGIRVPQLHAVDLENGFLLLEDFGGKTYHTVLQADNARALYQTAIHSLLQIQQYQPTAAWSPPPFDTSWMMKELEQFHFWFLKNYLELSVEPQTFMLQNQFESIVNVATGQPQVCIHRDYHSKNLMYLPREPHFDVGILDFQDAMWGPITYDLVSLLRDCYVLWDAQTISHCLHYYHQHASLKGICNESFEQFSYWFDLMGLQRHLKAIFIFARKKMRDNDPRYLQYIPIALQHVKTVFHQYETLEPLHAFFLENNIFDLIGTHE